MRSPLCELVEFPGCEVGSEFMAGMEANAQGFWGRPVAVMPNFRPDPALQALGVGDRRIEAVACLDQIATGGITNSHLWLDVDGDRAGDQ